MSEVPSFALTGQTALVTGAARGLGRAIALALADAGADVALGLRRDGTADDLIAVWLAGSDFKQERTLLVKFGASSRTGRLDALNETGEMLGIAEGVVYFLPERLRVHRARPIIGVTFHVGDLQAAAGVLNDAGVQFRTLPGSVLLAPAVTGGLWIELTTRRLTS